MLMRNVTSKVLIDESLTNSIMLSENIKCAGFKVPEFGIAEASLAIVALPRTAYRVDTGWLLGKKVAVNLRELGLYEKITEYLSDIAGKSVSQSSIWSQRPAS